jgi:general transcriptional corepressor CYC8
MGDPEAALVCYERALTHNQWSVPALLGIASVLREKEQFMPATEYLKTILKVDQNNGEVWGSLGTYCQLEVNRQY